MHTDRIDFISAYCDSWCERCGFTSRCSAFAVQAALGMCGDGGGALELAVGLPAPVEAAPRDQVFTAHVERAEPSDRELRERIGHDTMRFARIQATPMMKNANAIAALAHACLSSVLSAGQVQDDKVLVEALEVARWDSTVVGAKLARALSGRDRQDEDGDSNEDLVQNDWNGSAKVALISIDRSVDAWEVIAQATGDVAAVGLALALDDLRRLVEQEFPSARRFVRPGFDEPYC